MLKALYDYAVKEQLVLPPGYVNKTIKAYIMLSREGKFLGFEQNESVSVPCPDIGSLANGTDKCNVLVEKVAIVLSGEESAKGRFFRKTLKDGASIDHALTFCIAALEDESVLYQIQLEKEKRKLKPSDRISFCVGGIPIIKSDAIAKWWQDYRIQFMKSDKQNESLCLITGKPTIPVATVAPINGLKDVGGHARGDALICFDKSSFCSYGLKQAANAPVSEEAFAAVKTALDSLLINAPILAGMKFVHWYDEPIPRAQDCLVSFSLGEDEEEPEEEPEEEELLLQKQRENIAVQSADNLVKSVDSGQHIAPLHNRYHILLLTGVNGRVMIRRYEQGSYEQLQDNISKWESDLALCNRLGTGTLKPVKLIARLLQLLSRQKVDKKRFERAKKELSGITPMVIISILTGTPFPEAVAVRALSYIRSQMLDNGDEITTPPIPDDISCQWLKVWILHNNRGNKKEELLMPYYNPMHPSSAYQCGALMAIYADIQHSAMSDVNAGVIQRYYASASRSPAMAIGQLARLSNYHLAKIENKWLVQKYEEKLNCVYTAIQGIPGREIPVVLNLEEQAYFALGYRQMAAQIVKERKERQAAKKEAISITEDKHNEEGGTQDVDSESL